MSYIHVRILCCFAGHFVIIALQVLYYCYCCSYYSTIGHKTAGRLNWRWCGGRYAQRAATHVYLPSSSVLSSVPPLTRRG